VLFAPIRTDRVARSVGAETGHLHGSGAEFPLYSQGVRAGSTVRVSGMVGIDVATGAMAGDTIQDKTVQALRNCTAIVEAAGGRLDDVVQVTVLLTNPSDFAGMNDAYARVFTTHSRLRGPLPNSESSYLAFSSR
jgi:enamine deaminase RidA (YjgF/YER057c/UK114 family)